KKKGFKEERVTTIGLDDIGTSTTLESNKSEIPTPMIAPRPRATRSQTVRTRWSWWAPASVSATRSRNGFVRRSLLSMGASRVDGVAPRVSPRERETSEACGDAAIALVARCLACRSLAHGPRQQATATRSGLGPVPQLFAPNRPEAEEPTGAQ